jgi:hypothetical protein
MIRTGLVLGLLAAFMIEDKPAQAAEMTFDSGNKMLALCESTIPFEYGACVGFISGVALMVNGASQQGGNFLGWRVCVRNGVTVGQLRDIVVQDLQAHPENRDLGATLLVMRALQATFPCR